MSVGYMPPGATTVSLMPTTNVAAFDPGVDYVTGAAATVGFENVLFGIDAAVNDGSAQSGRVGHVNKLGVEGTPGRSRWRLWFQIAGCDALSQ